MSIQLKIKGFLKRHARATAPQIASHFGFSRQYANQLLRSLINTGDIVKFGSTRGAFYTLPQQINQVGPAILHRRFRNHNLEEHIIFDSLSAAFPAFHAAKENVRSLFHYAFSEMLNNAIEHSGAKNIDIQMASDRDRLHFGARDFGIGVFRNVMRQRHLKSEFEAMQDLLKGKMTTAPQAHSGEGIFFTSKAADRFAMESFGYGMIVDNTIPDIFFQETKPAYRGTRVFFPFQKKAAGI